MKIESFYEMRLCLGEQIGYEPLFLGTLGSLVATPSASYFHPGHKRFRTAGWYKGKENYESLSRLVTLSLICLATVWSWTAWGRSMKQD